MVETSGLSSEASAELVARYRLPGNQSQLRLLVRSIYQACMQLCMYVCIYLCMHGLMVCMYVYTGMYVLY